jgi:hypothetical protein
MSVLVTLSDLTWSLQNNLTGWFGLDWTVNLLASLLKRLGDQHALREFGSSEFVSAKYAGNWGRRRGGVLSPRGRVWTFQHLVWSTAFDFSELRAAHVIVPDETDATKIPRLTMYGTVLLVEPLGTLDGKKIDVDPDRDNRPFLLQGSAVRRTGLRGWTRMGGRAQPVYPGSLVPHFPAGGLHLDQSGSSLKDFSSERHGGQLVADIAIGGTTFDLVTLSDGFSGDVNQGDPFTVEGDPQTYVAANTVPAIGKQVSNIDFTPPAATKWKKGADVDFKNAFATPAPQACRVTELDADGKLLRGTIEPQSLVVLAKSGLGITDGELFYLVDPAGTGQKAEVARAAEGPGTTRVRLRGDDVPLLGRVSVKISGIAPTPAGEATPALTRVDDKKLGVPAGPPPYAAGDVLQLTDGALPKPLVTAVTALAAELEVDEALPSLASSGTVALLALLDAEADRAAKLGEGGQVVDFQVDPATPVGALPNEGTVLGIVGAAPGDTRIPAIVTKKIDDHQVKLDRKVGDPADEVTVRTLTRKSDLGKDPKASGTTLTYAPAAPATAPVVDAFVLVHAGKKAARRVTSITFDGVLVDQSVPVAAATPTATRFPRRVSKLDGSAQPVAPVWVLTGAAIDNRAKALALRGFTPMPPAAGVRPIAMPAGATVTAGVVKAALVGAAPPAVPVVGSLVLATVGAASVLAVVKQMQLDVTLDRPLPPEASAAGLELVALAAGAEYTASARDARLVTVLPALGGLPGVQVEMPRFVAGQLVLVTDATAAPPVSRSYRVSAVQGTTITLEAGPADLAGPFPKAVTVQRLDARDPATGSTRIAVNGTIPGADRKKLTFDVWSPGGIAPHDHVAVVDGARVFPAAVDALDELRITLTTEGPLADGAVTLDAPVPTFTTWAAVVNHDGNDVVMDGAVVARAAGVFDVAVVPYVASARVVPGQLSPGTVKVPERLDDRYDLDRFEALIEHELHHTVQSAEMGPLLLSFLPMWALELYAEHKTGEERAKFTGDWKTYQEIIEATTTGGVLDLVAGSVYGALVWLILVLVHELNGVLAKDGGGPFDAIDPFALDYFPGVVPDPAKPDTITVQPLDGKTLALTVGDRVQFKKPSDSRPLTFFSGGRTVTAVAGSTVTLDSADLPLENNATAVAKLSAGKGTPIETFDNSVLRGFGLGWMSVLFDPYGELAFRVAPQPGSFSDVLLRIGRYAFGTRSWGPVVFSGVAFWDNLRRQWGFLAANKPYLSRMEMGASYASGDTYYPLGLLRASGDAAGLLQNKQLVVGDVAQAWFLPDGGNRRDFSLVQEGKLAAPGVPVARSVCQMPFVDVPAVPNLAFPITQGAEIDAVVPQSGLAVPDTFVSKNPALLLEPDPALVPRQFRASPRGAIPVSAAMERTAGMYVAFCQPSTRGARSYRHRFTVVDGVEGDASAREAFKDRGIDLIHDLQVLDVTVRVGGRLVAEGADLALLPFERARVAVRPNGARRYEATVTRPTDGDIRRIDGDLSLQAAKNAAAEAVEISRIYRYVDGKGFDGGGLATWGMHVPADVHIPVRRFRVKVDPVLPPRAAADPDSPAAGPFKPGQKVFLLVPVRLRPSRPAKQNPTVTVTFTTPAPTGITEPRLSADLGAVDPTTDPKLSPMFAFGGRVLTIALPVDDPPEQDIRVDVSVDVGPDDANTAPCTASFTVQPHFTLARHGGGADFKVAPGDTIMLDCSGGVKAGKVTASPAAGITIKPTAGSIEIDVAAGTTAGPVRILVEDAADATHEALRTVTVA